LFTKIWKHILKGGEAVLAGLEIGYIVNYEESKLPAPVKKAIGKLCELDEVDGEEITEFPKIKAVFKHGGERYKITKNSSRITLKATDIETGEDVTTKYQINCGRDGDLPY
jgi:hypothetical protein